MTELPVKEQLQEKVLRRLGAVRRAWKRTAAISGAVIVCIETVGLLTIAFLIDWIYRPAPAVRLGILAAVAAAVVALVVRHVIRPLLKRISDEQLALFVEEHNEAFEGALITAAELARAKGRKTSADGDGLPPQAIIDAVVRSAARRAEGLRASSIIDLGRLKKYGIAAVVLLAVYGAACLAFPSAIGRHASRVLVPWQVPPAELPPPPVVQKPIEISLSRGNAEILRGSAFKVEAVLSRASDQPIAINFRPAADAKAQWRAMPMGEIEKLNGFEAKLPDVNEETEFFVATGSARTPVFKIAVFDPLILQEVEVTTKYPPYLQLPDRVESFSATSSSDVSAPEGSKVTVRVVANRAMTGGTMTWKDGSQQAMSLEPRGDKVCAAATFDVKAENAYSFEIVDSNNQKAAAGPSAVHALKDLPPTLELKFPLGSVSASPLGEITFSAQAADDFGVASVELIYDRPLCSDTQPHRIAMQLERPAGAAAYPDAVVATARLALEDLQPRIAPEEIISFHLQSTDRKGQKAITDLGQIVVNHFENWPTIDTREPEDTTPMALASLDDYVKATWKLDQQKPLLSADDYNKQCLEIAKSMLDPATGKIFSFYDPRKVPPEKMEHAKRADQFTQSGHKSLEAYDTAKALADFKVAMAELTVIGVGDLTQLPMFASAGGAGNNMQKDMSKLLQQIQTDAAKSAKLDATKQSLDLAKTAEQIQKAAADLKNQQDEIARKIGQMQKDDQQAGEKDPAKKGEPDKADPNKGEPDKADPNKGEPNKDKQNKDAGDLANKEDKLAEKTQEQGNKAKEAGDKDPSLRQMAGRIEDASKAMREASQNLRGDKLEEALADAKRAASELQKAAERLETVRQEKLAAAIAAAEAEAGKLLKNQKDLTGETDAAAKKDDKSTDADKDREYKKLAFRQGQLNADAQKLRQTLEDLRDSSQRDSRADTAKHIEESHREMTRGEVDQKMANAVVELTGKRGEAAKTEQTDAQKTLEGVVSALRKAGDSMAADRESELRRARSEAKTIDEGLRDLGAEAKAPTTGPANQQVATSAPAAQPKALTDKEKKNLAEDVAYALQRFAQHVEDRDFAAKEDIDKLRTASAGQSPEDLQQDSAKRNDLATVVRRVRNKLETEYQSQLDAKKLLSAQREECPPSYRRLVNKYYEALSEAGR